MTIDLEAAWNAFLERDLSIETALAIEFAHLNNTKFNTLQLAARSATKGDRRPADQLAKFAGRVGSALVSTTLGRLYELAGFDEEALEFHLSALEFTPRWDAHLCSTMLNNIAWTGVLLGELEVAERWALRALEFDPCNPYATGTLCEALAQREPVRAEGLYRWLQARKFSAAAWGTYTPNPKLAQVQDYRPSLPVHKATNEDLLRLMVANHHDTNRPEPVKLRSLALALLSAGRPARAALVAQQAKAAASDDEAAWSGALAELAAGLLSEEQAAQLKGRKGSFALAPSKRESAIAKLVKAKDEASLWDLIYDPSRQVSLCACQGLLQLGVREPLLPYLTLADELEGKTGTRILRDTNPKPYDLLPIARQEAAQRLRGVALVEAVIRKIEADDSHIDIAVPEPVPAEVLDALTLPGKLPLPPSMRRFLEFDGGWMARELGWFDDPYNPEFPSLSVATAVREKLDAEYFWPCFKVLPKPLPNPKVLPLGNGSETMRVLFLAKPDEHGEYPIFNVSIDDMPGLGPYAPGFDVWLAMAAGLVADADVEYAEDMAALRKRLTRGREWLDADFFEDEDFEEGDEDEEDFEEEEPAPKPKPKAAAGPVEVPAKLSEDKLGRALMQAIEGNNSERIRAFLDAAKTRFPKGKKWQSLALIQAVFSSNRAVVHELLECGADPDTEGTYGRVLQTAARHGEMDILDALLAAGANPNKADKDKDTALCEAADKKQVASVRRLLDAGANPNKADSNGMTPLHQALHLFLSQEHDRAEANANATQLCALLLEHGAAVDTQDGNGRTALHWAVDQGLEAAVDLLLAQKPNLELTQWDGDTPLTHAWRNGHAAIFDKLAAAGARRDVCNHDGWCVDDVTAPGSQRPKLFDVQVRCSEQPQKVKLHLRLIAPNSYHVKPEPILHGIALLDRLARAGMVGSDVFPPAEGKAAWNGGITSSAGRRPRSRKKEYDTPDAIFDIDGTYTLRAVAPAVLGLWLRGLVRMPGLRLAELSLVGEEPCDGSDLCVDSAQVQAWGEGERIEVQTWPSLPFALTDTAADKVLCLVKTTGKAKATLPLAFGEALTLLDPAPGAPAAYVGIDGPIKVGDWLQVNYQVYGTSKRPPFPRDLAQTKALFLNHLASLGKVEAVQWALDGEPSAKPKKAKKTGKA